MKAHRETPKPEFIPVTLILESQEEVDGVYALLNHLRVNDAAKLPYHAFKKLLPFVNQDNAAFLHSQIDALIK